MDIKEQREREALSRELETIRAKMLELAESVAKVHRRVATSHYPTIATCTGDLYNTSATMLYSAVRASFPNMDPVAILEVWEDYHETIADCAKVVENRISDNCFMCGASYQRGEMREADIMGRKRLICPECYKRCETD